MQKKIISFIISLSLVLGAVAPCFAVDLATSSSISLKSASFLSDSKATTAATTVEPDDSQATRYYVNSNGSVTSSSTWINTWGNIVTDITYSLAYSADIIENRLLTLINNLSSYLYSSSTTGYYLWDWSSSNGPIQGAPTGTQSVISQLRALGSSLSKLISYSTEYNYQASQSLNKIEEVLTTSGGIEVSLGSPWQPYFMPADNYDFNTNDWDYYYIRTVDEWGTVSSTSFTNTNILMGLKRLLVNLNNNNTYGFRNIANGVGGNNNSSFVPKIYNTDLSTKNASKISVWKSILEYGENTSMFLSRLAFVLASDEEIAARQAAQANQDAVVDDFISSSGSASASTSDFADIASAGSSMKSALDSNVSISNAFTAFDSSSSAWDWFSQATADSLDSTSNSRRKGGSYTPMLDSYYDQLMETLRFK